MSLRRGGTRALAYSILSSTFGSHQVHGVSLYPLQLVRLYFARMAHPLTKHASNAAFDLEGARSYSPPKSIEKLRRCHRKFKLLQTHAARRHQRAPPFSLDVFASGILWGARSLGRIAAGGRRTCPADLRPLRVVHLRQAEQAKRLSMDPL